jgi:hypothetical protein
MEKAVPPGEDIRDPTFPGMLSRNGIFRKKRKMGDQSITASVGVKHHPPDSWKYGTAEFLQGPGIATIRKIVSVRTLRWATNIQVNSVIPI